jgi:hypothetical protein
MKRFLLASVLWAVAGQSYAGWVGGAQIVEVNSGSDGYASISVASAPTGTCSNWGYHFRFDASTSGGKNMLASLLAAKLAATTVNIWYADSANPGTNQSNGCNNSTMAVLQGVSVQ